MKPKHILVVGFLAAGLMALVAVAHISLRKHRGSPPVPYADADAIAADVRGLPALVKDRGLITSAWAHYTRVAQRCKVTRPEVIQEALTRLAGDRGHNAPNVKSMLLLRVCFECPEGLSPPRTYGGWISFSAAHAGRTNYDANWPISRKFGRFYLIDTIDGYTGTPYDPAVEFQWLRTNCAWRSL